MSSNAPIHSQACRTIVLTAALGPCTALAGPSMKQESRPTASAKTHTAKQQAIAPITAAAAVSDMLPLTLDMLDLNDHGKHVRLPGSLPTHAVRPGPIRTGDVVLDGSDTLVVFYKTFPSSYSYTRVGSVTQVDGLAQALGTGRQRIGFVLD